MKSEQENDIIKSDIKAEQENSQQDRLQNQAQIQQEVNQNQGNQLSNQLNQEEYIIYSNLQISPQPPTLTKKQKKLLKCNISACIDFSRRNSEETSLTIKQNIDSWTQFCIQDVQRLITKLPHPKQITKDFIVFEIKKIKFKLYTIIQNQAYWVRLVYKDENNQFYGICDQENKRRELTMALVNQINGFIISEDFKDFNKGQHWYFDIVGLDHSQTFIQKFENILRGLNPDGKTWNENQNCLDCIQVNTACTFFNKFEKIELDYVMLEIGGIFQGKTKFLTTSKKDSVNLTDIPIDDKKVRCLWGRIGY